MANTCFPVSPSPCLWPIPPALLGPWIQARKGHSSCLGQSRMDQGAGCGSQREVTVGTVSGIRHHVARPALGVLGACSVPRCCPGTCFS